MTQRPLIPLLVAASLTLAVPLTAQTPAADGGTLGFYRFPTLHDDVLVFAAEGDLWRVPKDLAVGPFEELGLGQMQRPMVMSNRVGTAFTMLAGTK